MKFTGYYQGFGSVFIWHGSGSSILGWILIRIQHGSGSSPDPGFLWQKFFALLVPDSEYGSGSNYLIESGSETVDTTVPVPGYLFDKWQHIFFNGNKIANWRFPLKWGTGTQFLNISILFLFLTDLRPNGQMSNVADPRCLSRILIFTHPGSRIQKQKQNGGVKKLLSYLFCSH